MRVTDEVRYRLRLTEGFLTEARQDWTLARWRSCVDDSQLAVENAAKAALALVGPVGRTHNPAALLRQGLAEGRFPQLAMLAVTRLAECAELLGPDVHTDSDYGDESRQRTPWDLFNEGEAQQALELAEEGLLLANSLLDLITGGASAP